MKLKLKITGPVAIHGKQPGQVFEVRCDRNGVPEDESWRRRLRDEKRWRCGAVEVVKDQPRKAKEAVS